MNTILSRVAAAALALSFAGAASAVPSIPGFEADDGAELFTPNDTVISVEIFDLGDLLGNPYEFGFYFGSDPNNPPDQITIFDETDVGAANSAIAFIDFDAGFVFDVDEGALQDLFSPTAGPIGFWLATGGNTFYSEAARNPGGADVVETLQQTANSENYLIGFEIALFGNDILLGLEFVGGLTAVTVAEPMTLGLFGLGLIGVAYARRRRT